MRERYDQAVADFECAIAERGAEKYVLTLLVTGMTARSMRAIARIKMVCEEHLQGRYQLEIVDIYQDPEMARREQVVAAPTLIKKLPLPLRRMVGDLSDESRVLAGLDLRAIE